MAFCQHCGARVSGKFCSVCGTPAVPAEVSQAPDTAPALAPRKTSPVVWILVAVVGMFVLFGIALIGGGFLLAHKAKQAGIDTELMRNNPGLATAKLLAATDPDVEVVSSDDQHGLITLRQKSTGKTVTLNLDDMKQGKFTFNEDSPPAWVPLYPNSASAGSFSANNFTCQTRDSPAQVIAFYQRELTRTGFQTHTTPGLISATDSANHRNLLVTARNDNQSTKVSVTYSQK